ncbi:MAG: META domain-containing protein [Fluviicola sp.]|nr:META domain-containing protein [Fluviicola sp.]MBP6271987.1 META domain-containing protein [Fluviicola sp.]
MKHLLFLAIALLLNTTSFAQTQLQLIVHPEQVDCQRMMPQKCLQVRINGAKEWTLFYERILGFTFEPGYRYELLVVQTKRPEPLPADLSEFIYKLEKIVSKTAVVSDIQPSNWKIMEIAGEAVQQQNLSVQVDPTKNSIAGYGGCNRFFGEATWNSKKNKVNIGDLASTKMYCENTIKMEDKLLALLSGKSFKVVYKNEQIHFQQKRKTVLVFQVQPAEEMSTKDESAIEEVDANKNPSPMTYFNDKELKLIQLNGKTITTTINTSIHFNLNTNSFTGNGGCNQLFGECSFNDNIITIASVNATKMLCMDEAVTQVEKAFIANLNLQTLQVDYAENVLNCYNANGELIMMFAIQK